MSLFSNSAIRAKQILIFFREDTTKSSWPTNIRLIAAWLVSRELSLQNEQTKISHPWPASHACHWSKPAPCLYTAVACADRVTNTAAEHLAPEPFAWMNDIIDVEFFNYAKQLWGNHWFLYSFNRVVIWTRYESQKAVLGLFPAGLFPADFSPLCLFLAGLSPGRSFPS